MHTTRFPTPILIFALALVCFFLVACEFRPLVEEQRESIAQEIVATPQFAPAREQVASTETLILSTSTPGASIYYSTDGNEPTTSSPRYTVPLSFDSLGEAATYTIRAIAAKTRFDNSDIAEMTFTLTDPGSVATPFISPGRETVTPSESLTMGTNTPGAVIFYSRDGTTPSSTRDSTSIQYRSSIPFRTFGRGTHIIRAIAVKEGLHDSAMVQASFTVSKETVATPILSSAQGKVLDTERLTISSTNGATIHYTTDGSTPGRLSPVYRSALDFGSFGLGTRTVRVMAVKRGYKDSEMVSVTFTVEHDVDEDNDGLIEIRNLEMFNNIRYNLAGTSYDDELDDDPSEDPENLGDSTGAPPELPPACEGRESSTHLCGYELTRSLNFAVGGSYASGRVNRDWRPNNSDPDLATNEGFSGFGAESGTEGFSAIFEGNGHTISNFYSRNSGETGENIGLFRVAKSTAIIRNSALVEARVYGGSVGDSLGALVGTNSGTIIASHSTGVVNGQEGSDYSGGLVGYTSTGSKIMASYSRGEVRGGEGSDYVGGLIGYTKQGTVTASFSSADVFGGDNGYAIGGLVGSDDRGVYRSNYATGNTFVGGGTRNLVGGLIGEGSSTMVIASYSIGDLRGMDEGTDSLGELMGAGVNVMITESYGFGKTYQGQEYAGTAGTDLPGTVTGPEDFTATGAESPGSSWDSTSGNKAWDFGSDVQLPALIYNDYDGGGTEHRSCSDDNGGFPATIPGSTTELSCGSTLIGGKPIQGRL